LILGRVGSNLAFAEERPTVKIGMILSLTGAWAEFGQAQAQALLLAKEREPARFSNIKFITEDCRYGGKEAVAAFNKLHSVDKVDLIFVWGVEPALAVAPLAERNRVPLIVSAVVPATARGRKYVIRTINYAEQQAQTILKYFRTLNYKKIAIIKAQISFYDIFIDGLRKNLASDESLQIIDDILPTDTDLGSIVSKAKRESFDILGLFLSPSQILEFYQEASSQNLKIQVFGASPLQSRTLVKQAVGRMEGTLYVHNDVTTDFENAYISRFGDDIQIPWAANTYDFLMLAGRMLNNLDHRPAAEEILSLFSGAREGNGAGGPFHYVDSVEEGKYFEYPIVVKRIEGESFSLVFKNSVFE
jgi:ABC-type branched-subunit amino acid transport system substrate-binding protein